MRWDLEVTLGRLIVCRFYLTFLQALKKVGKDPTILMLCVTVFLSYLPEAGQYSCFFVYLQLVRVNRVSVLLDYLFTQLQSAICFGSASLPDS